jgi:hypothetical protein
MGKKESTMTTIKQDIRPNKMIWVTFDKEGVHYYPGADTDPKLATGDWDDVSFLGYLHRHIFKFRVWIEVFHDDRDIEFIQFKRWLQRLYEEVDHSTSVLELNHKSCSNIQAVRFGLRSPKTEKMVHSSNTNRKT